MMYKPLYAIVLLYATSCSFAQTTDHFSDENFSANPAWVGDDSLFQVSPSFQLQSKGSSSKDISLATAVSFFSEMEWQCWVRFNLSPSTSNFCRYYLLSNTPDIKGAANGYYLQFGGVTGNTDSITLYKQKGTTRTRILAGRPATVAKSTNTVRIKVLRDVSGNWQLFSDTTGGSSFILEGAGKDAEFINDGYIVFFVRYTATNAFNYFLDDVYAGPKIIDTTPPIIDSLTVLSPTQLRLAFSEPLEMTSALDANHYTLNHNIGTPANIEFEQGKTNSIILELNDPLSNQSYELSCSGIADLNGNTSTLQQVPFLYDYYEAKENDIVISEFFPDPTPPIGLPEKEFIELYNRTTQAINVSGWSISDGSTTAVLSNTILPPDSFIIICANAFVGDFSPFGKVCSVTTLPSLNNTSDQIVLRDATGKIIHQLRYDLSSYANTSKQDGGFTIEMNNPQQLCLDKQNFAASDDPWGGTPGRKNSRWSKENDTSSPYLKQIEAPDSFSLVLVFSERMDSLSLLLSTITLQGNSVTDKSVSPNHDTLFLRLALPLSSNKTSTLSIDNARDCSGNFILPASKSFTYFVPDRAHQFDILMNELMADPDPPVRLPEAEYVELHNRSGKYISLKDWTLSDISSTAILPSFILQPDSFMIITSLSNSSKFTATNTIGVSGFPSLGNDGDALTLKDERGNIIHHLIYSSNAYRDNVKKNGGWSIELMDPQNPCGGDHNLAASTNSKGGTPGFTNSRKQFSPDKTPPQLIKVYPLSQTQLQVQFSEQMDSVSLQSLTHYQSSLGSSFPSHIRLIAPDYIKIELLSNDSFQRQTIYRLLVDSVKDCAGNTIEQNNYTDFGMPETIDSGDIVINELLFDPRGDGSDFVEIINRTDKILDLKKVWIANADEHNQINDFYPVDSTGWLLLPSSYALITDNPASVTSNYATPDPKQFIQTKLPSFPNDEGHCILLKTTGERLDQLDYTDKMHYALLDTKDGVSLERIDWNRPSSDVSNWTSASSTCGFATPTYQNSQYAKASKGLDLLRIEPEVFSPDGDGFHDFVTFSYTLPSSGYSANVYIYNAAGILVKHLLRNEIMGTTGSFGWNGFTDNGEKATIGIYVYYFEAFNLKGDVVKAKSTLVVGAKL